MGDNSRLDLALGRPPLRDKLLTSLQDLRVPRILVSQPCLDGTTETVAAESIAIEGGWRRKSSEEEEGAKDEDGRERREGRAGGHLVGSTVL